MELNQVARLDEQMDANKLHSPSDTPMVPVTPAKTNIASFYRQNGNGDACKETSSYIPGSFTRQILDLNNSVAVKSCPVRSENSNADFSQQHVGNHLLFNDPSVINFTPLSRSSKDNPFPPKLILLCGTNHPQYETAWTGASEMICTPLDPVTPFKTKESYRGSILHEHLDICSENRESDELEHSVADLINSNSSSAAAHDSDTQDYSDERQKDCQQAEVTDHSCQSPKSNKRSSSLKYQFDLSRYTEFHSDPSEEEKDEQKQTSNTEPVRTVDQKTKRKKIRAKVVKEGSSRKRNPATPKQVTPKPARCRTGKSSAKSSGTSSDWLQQKRVESCKQKKRSINSLSKSTLPMQETSQSTNALEKSAQRRSFNENKSVRRKLTFESEEPTVAAVVNYQGTRCNISAACFSGSDMQAKLELVRNSSSQMVYDLHHSRNKQLEDYICQLQDLEPPCRREKPTESWKHLDTKAGTERSIHNLKYDEPSGYLDVNRSTLNIKENMNLAGNLSVGSGSEGSHMCTHSDQYTKDNSTSLVTDLIQVPGPFKVYKRRRTQGPQSEQSFLAKRFPNIFGSLKEQNLATPDKSRAQAFNLALEMSKILRRKRSITKQARRSINVAATNHWDKLLLNPTVQPPLCMAALSTDNSFKIKTKRRTKKLLKPILQNADRHKIPVHYFLGQRPDLSSGSSRNLQRKILLHFNFMSMQEPLSFKPNGAIVPYSNQNELVLHQRQLNLRASRRGAMVPYRDFDKSFEIRKKNPRAKVDLDLETKRVFDLLMWNKGSNEEDESDAVKQKRWQEEREIFRGRVDLFISRMHLIQGDRRFSRWKGSILDSVVGVFLTQNVTDNLSSSAFMALAAKFPLVSQTNSESCATSQNQITEHKVNSSSDEISLQEDKSPGDQSQDFQDSGSANKLVKNSRNCENLDDKVLEDEGLDNKAGFGKQFCSLDASETVKRNVDIEDMETNGYTMFVNNYIALSEPFLDDLELLIDPLAAKFNESCRLDLVNLQTPSSEACTNQNNDIHANNTSILPPESDVLCQETRERGDNGTVQLNALENNLGTDVKPSSKNADHFVDSEESFRLSLVGPSLAGTLDEMVSGRQVREERIVVLPHSSQEISATNTAEIRCKNCDQSSVGAMDFPDENGAKFQKSGNTEHLQAYNSEPIGGVLYRDHQYTSQEENLCTWNEAGETAEEIMLVETVTEGQNCSSGNVATEVAKGEAKSKTAKVEKKIPNFDWDSLRKEACLNGYTTERSSETMDSLNWEAVRCADVNEISEAIQERGMNNVLAVRIKDFLNRLKREHGSLDLEWLRNVPPAKTKDYLLSIRGLGLKSVECVRLLALDQHAFPVDTNVGRICVRLGWVPIEPLPEEIQFYLVELYPILENIQKYLWPRLCKLDKRTLYELHYQMIIFGKVFCTKRKPNCNACPLKGECKHFASAFASVRLALPGPEDTHSASASLQTAERVTDLPLIQEERKIQERDPGPILPLLEGDKIPERVENDCAPIVECPSSPELVADEPCDIEDSFFEDPDEIPEIKLNIEDFKRNLQHYMEESKDFQDGDIEKALVAVSRGVASIPVPPLKYVSRLRTEHQTYELPDNHPLLDGLDQRERDDPCPYLLIVWAPGEMADSVGKSETCCDSVETGKLCDNEACFHCSAKREEQAQVVRGTLLIPCRTAMRGRFPLNGTYFQVNEIFADHQSSYDPISVPRGWIWNLQRRAVTMGTGTSAIFAGRSVEEIQSCFRKGFICTRGFDRKTRAPKPLAKRLHYSANRVARKKTKVAMDAQQP